MIQDGVMVLSTLGHVAVEEWTRIGQIRPCVRVDEFVVMPDHLHGILIFGDWAPGRVASLDSTQGRAARAQPDSLGSVIGGFKSAVTSRARRAVGDPSLELWQRNFHERLVWSVYALDRVRRYIIENPMNWSDGRDPARDWERVIPDVVGELAAG
jgi:REP element-mobilizing transposase RayT